MKIKVLMSCSGLDYSYHQGQTVETISEIAKDLIEAGFAVEVKADKTVSKSTVKEGAENATT